MKFGGLVIALTFAALSSADPIPTLTFTSGYGYVAFGYNPPPPAPPSPGAQADISGPGYSVGFYDFWPGIAFVTSGGSAFPDDAPLFLGEITNPPAVPHGSLVVDGTNYTGLILSGGTGLGVQVLTSITVPSSGSGSFSLPAVFSGSVTACVPESSPPFPPLTCQIDVANLNFDIPGTLDVTFTPTGTTTTGGPPQEVANWAATFTPVPESSSVLLMLGGLAIFAIFRIARTRRVSR